MDNRNYRNKNTSGGYGNRSGSTGGAEKRYSDKKPYGGYSDKPRSDKPYSEKPRSDKPYSDKPYQSKPYSDKPRSDKPYSDKPYQSKPYSDKPRSDKPYSDKPYQSKSYSDKPRSDKPYSDKPYQSKPYSDKPRSDKPYSDKPYQSKPYSDKPRSDKPYSDKPRSDKPYSNKPYSDKPYQGKSYGDKPYRGKTVGKPYGGKNYHADTKRYMDASAQSRPPKNDFRGRNPQSPRPDFKAQQSGDDEKMESYAIVGRNAVLELLKSDRDVDKIFVQKPAEGETRTGSITVIVAQAVEKKIPVIEVERAKLDALAEGVPHQGVAALAPEHNYATLDDVFALAKERGEKPLIIIADGIEDPHNLGAIIRVAEGAGAHGIIIPKRRSSPMTQVVAKASAGAVEYLPIVKVPNISQTVDTLKKLGVWVFCAEAGGEAYDTCDWNVPAAIVLGSEGEGVSQIVRSKCDRVVSIPMRGKVNSLNVSTAAAVLVYEAAKTRIGESPAVPAAEIEIDAEIEIEPEIPLDPETF